MNAAGDKRSFTLGHYTARLLRQAVRDADQLLDEAITVAGERRSGAGVTKMEAWVVSQPKPGHLTVVFRQNGETIERLLRTCKDLAEATAVVLEKNGSRVGTSPFVLLRSLGEAAMNVCYILDANVPPARTYLRMATYQLASFEGSLRGNQAFGQNHVEDGKRIQEAIRDAHEWFTEAGFTLVPDPRREFRTAALKLGGHTENLGINATDAFQKYVPGSPWQWETGSGVAHAKGWALNSIVPAAGEPASASSIEGILAGALPILEVVDALGRAAEGHTGVDAAWFFQKNHLRRRGLLQWTGKGGPVVVDYAEFARRDLNWKAQDHGKPFWGRPVTK